MQSIRGVTVDRHFPGKYSGARFAGTGRRGIVAGEYFVVPVDLQSVRSTRYSLQTLSRSNLIGTPQRLYAPSLPHNRTMCVHCVRGGSTFPSLRFAYTRISRAASRRSAKGENIGTRGEIEREREWILVDNVAAR